MITGWVFRIPASAAAALADLRQHEQLRVARDGDCYWVQATHLPENLARDLHSLPAGELFEILPGEKLRQSGRLVPDGKLPQLAWQPIREAVTLTLPVAAWAGDVAAPCPLQLVRANIEQDANVLLLPWDRFEQWGLNAPAVRLAGLRFAVRSDGQTLLHGTPLPPLEGRLFVESRGIALPAGWTWHSPIDAELLARTANLAPGAVALWSVQGGYEVIADDQFVRATRSAIRETADRLREGASA